MTTKHTLESEYSSRSAELSATEIFPLLAEARRRYVLHYLSQRVGAVSLGELAEQLALWEDTPSRDHYERILTSLYHSHLPKLIDAGLIRYEVEQETVVELDTMNKVDPYLDLAVADDVL